MGAICYSQKINITMSDTQQREYDDILRGVVVDENTFLVRKSDGATLAIIDDIIDKLTKFRNNIDFKFRSIVSDKIIFLLGINCDILKGTYFSSMDDVWKTEDASFDNANINIFNRPYNDTLNEVSQGYQDTAIGAIDSNNDVDDDSSADDSSQSSSNASDKDTIQQLDIFGVQSHIAELTYLMPQSPKCASLWTLSNGGYPDHP